MIRDSEFEARLNEARSKVATDPDLALSQARDLLDERSDARAISIMAEAYRVLGEIEQAEKTELLAIKASSRDPELRRAAVAIQHEQWAEAANIARAQLGSDNNLLGLTILAEALLGMRRAVDAEAAIRQVLERAPTFSRARTALSRSLILQCRITEAVAVLEDVVDAEPDNLSALELLIEPLVSLRRFDRAVEIHQQILALEDDSPRALVDFATTLRFAGRTSAAVDAVNRAISLDDSNGPAWWSLANMAPESISVTATENMEAALARSRDEDNSSYLHVALATMLDRSGDYERAFRHFATGKSIRKQAARYDPELLEADVDDLIRRFDANFFAEREGFGSVDASPIFIIGLPRSGSTLVERILTQHSQIEGAGELPVLFRMADELDAEAGQERGYRRLIRNLTTRRASTLGELYIQRAGEFRQTGKPFFTDKLNLNWLHLPLIRLILPNARIIDVRRHPIDCCWSNFKIIFAPGHPASDDLADMGRLYRQYVRLMDHAADWTNGRLLSVRYETLIENFETETRRILAFLGLDFEPACLKFHELNAPVATISAEQVRKPLNREGIGRWKPYREWLGPLFDALGSLAVG